MDVIYNYMSLYYSGVYDLPRNILIALLIAFFSLSLLVIFYFFIIIKRLIYIFCKSRDQYWTEQIDELLNMFLSDIDEEHIIDPVAKILSKFKKIPLKKRFIKHLLYQQILAYHKNFTGNAAEKLKELFLQLHLEDITKNKLHSGGVEIKIRGIMDTAQMVLTEFSPIVEQLLHHRSSEIRIEAQAAYIILNKAHAFDFLDEVNEPIQNWHQLVLLDLITRLNPNELPQFSRWLSSKNSSVIELCLKLIVHFQQFEAVGRIIDLLNHPDTEIKCLSIKALGEFEAVDAEQALLDCYAHESVEIQAEIIKALGRINSGKQLDFLKHAAALQQFEIAFEASKALIASGTKGIDLLKNYQVQAPPMNKQILNQLIG